MEAEKFDVERFDRRLQRIGALMDESLKRLKEGEVGEVDVARAVAEHYRRNQEQKEAELAASSGGPTVTYSFDARLHSAELLRFQQGPSAGKVLEEMFNWLNVREAEGENVGGWRGAELRLIIKKMEELLLEHGVVTEA